MHFERNPLLPGLLPQIRKIPKRKRLYPSSSHRRKLLPISNGWLRSSLKALQFLRDNQRHRFHDRFHRQNHNRHRQHLYRLPAYHPYQADRRLDRFANRPSFGGFRDVVFGGYRVYECLLNYFSHYSPVPICRCGYLLVGLQGHL